MRTRHTRRMKFDSVSCMGRADMEIVLKGQPVVNASLRAKDRPRTVKLNGRNVDVAYDKARDRVKVQLNQR